MSTFSIFGKSEMSALIDKFSLRERLVRKELANATNKAAREVVNLSIEEWNATQTARDYIRPRLKIVSGATESRLEAKVTGRSRHTRANNFRYAPLPSNRGVRLNVKRGVSGAIIKRAFVIPHAKSDGKPLILERISKYQKGESRDMKGGRFRALYGPSVNQFFFDARKRVAPEALSAAKQQFLRALL